VVKSAFFIIFGIKIGRFWPTTRAQGLGFLWNLAHLFISL
jgi:hypothetical protein